MSDETTTEATTSVPIAMSTNPIVAKVIADTTSNKASTSNLGFQAALEGNNENPSNESSGTGVAGVRLVNNSTEVEIQIIFAELTTDLISAHIHHGKVGENGPVVKTFILTPNDLQQTGMIQGSWTASSTDVSTTPPTSQPFNSDMKAKLQNGELYINLHTNTYIDGEIRGQIIPLNE